MNLFNIQRAFKHMRARGWPYMYWVVDFHDTLFEGRYSTDQELIISPDAWRVMRWATLRTDIKLIAFTCSYAKDFERVNTWLNGRGINFDFLNCNPECGDTHLAAFDKKFYFNVLLDDKAGFEADVDWTNIVKELDRLGEWDLQKIHEEAVELGGANYFERKKLTIYS